MRDDELGWSDAELRANALELWANHIETGSVTLGAQDLAQRGARVPVISTDQTRLVRRLRQLARQERQR